MKFNYYTKFVYLLTFIISIQTIQAQFTQWEQYESSDYFAKMEFYMNDPEAGSCSFYRLDYNFYVVGYSTDFGSKTTQPILPFAGQHHLEVGPGRTHDVSGSYNAYGSICSIYEQSDDVSISTDLPYPPGNFQATYLENGGVTLDWTNNTEIPNALHTIKLQYGQTILNLPGGTDTHTFTDCLPASTQFIWRVIFDGTVADSTYTVTGDPSVYTIPNPRPLPPPPSGGYGQISGTIKTTSGAGVGGVIVKATLMNNNDLGGCWPPEYLSQPSQGSGAFNIPDIYYDPDGPAAQYRVEAFLPGHQFRYPNASSMDSVIDYSLTSGLHNFNDANFIDITSYVISGSVTSSLFGCGVEDVTILEAPGGNSGIIPVKTAADGTFELVVPEGNKTYQIKASYRLGSIADSIISITIAEEDVGGADFIHTASETLSGFVGAGCNEYLGETSIEVRAPESGCLITTINPNANGYYSIELPARPLEVEVTGITLDPSSGLDEGEVLSGFGGVVETEFDSAQVIDFVFRKPLSLDVQGLPGLSCAAIPHPIIEQGKSYFLTLRVTEGDNCPVDTGKVVVFDNISASGVVGQILDSVVISNGLAIYELKPGDPNFFGDHLKDITFQAIAGEEMTQVTKMAIVTGAIQSGNNFTTAAPTELPFLILRDPPGDGSYASFSEESVTTIGQSYSTQVGGGVKVWAEAKVGTEIFGLELWGQIGGSFEINSSKSTTDEFVLEISNSQTFSTADDVNVIGEKGDVFVGAAVNFIYARAKTLDFDLQACALTQDTLLMLNANGFETTFIYTENYIRSNVIPTRQLIANNESLEDSVRYRAANDIKLWEQVLQLNQELKEEALSTAENYSWDSQVGSIEQSKSISVTKSKTLEFTTQIDVGVAAEVGFEFMNNGVTAGVDVNFQTTMGEVRTFESASVTTTTFHLEDGNQDNAFSVDVAEDAVFGTPVFKTLGGQTSCPHEEGTQELDNMTLFALNPVEVVESGNDAFFTFEIISNSFDNNPRKYFLELNPQSTNGAEVFFGSNNFTQPILISEIYPGSTTIGPIRVTRPNNLLQYDFEGIEFYLYPNCNSDYTLSDIVSVANVSAYFNSPCSNIDMSAPLDEWQVLQNSDQLLVTMSGYDLSNDFDKVIMQYKAKGSSNWLTSNVERLKSELLVGSTTVPWDLTNIKDGEYDIRFRLNCGTTFSFSNRTRGIIDRTAPRVFGIENPANDRYLPGKEISVQFHEDLDCSVLTQGNIYLKKIPENQLVAISTVCIGGKVNIVLQEEIGELYNQAFEVGLIGVTDLQGNERSDTVQWEFVVSEPDKDRDGVSDTKDRCPDGNDFLDSDMDGLPDDCDCLPDVATNGRLFSKAAMDFDGVDDHLSVAHNNTLNPGANVSFTFEAWVKIESSQGPLTILSKGSGTSTTNSYIFSIWQNKVALNIGDAGSNNTWMYSDSDVKLKKWTHLAVAYDHTNGVFTFFQDGIKDGERTITHGFSSNTNPLLIGNQGVDCNCNYFNGQLDELRMWNVAKTEAGLQAMMNQELSGSELNLIAYYNFNEGTAFGNNTDLTQVREHSPNALSADLINFDQQNIKSNWVNGPVRELNIAYELCKSCPDTSNVLLDFDMVDDYIHINNHPDLIPTSANTITFEAWIFPNNSASAQRILESSDGIFNNQFQMYLNEDSKIYILGLNFSSVTSHKTIESEQWTHIAIAFDQNACYVYINGILDIVQSFNVGTTNKGFPIIVGNHGGSGPANQGFNGRMDDIRFWNHRRTAEEIKDNLQKELTGEESGLLAYYNFNTGKAGQDNSASNIQIDASGNGHDGVLVGFSLNGSKSNYLTSPFNFSDGDRDGLPDVCDNCSAVKQLTIDNSLIDGVYRASEKIILGNGLSMPANANLTLRSPIVHVNQPIQTSSSATITIMPTPCDEEE
ncbi:LamG domain-containing protein [Portibacter lacus]|uniref:LamG-like jellyroll fold domain-containing protein n=1 Tax=Portibacter lacus TaxID=1099794 RepID=A0AA37SRI2_9BACT|nr:LamG domain-containing protein [Portibacter lacus]GLR19561.1 hypothetical protein GCM10007940_41770 [Portibacter lacus]